MRPTLLFLFLQLALSTQRANAQWQNLPSPFGGSVLQFEEDGADLYALTYGGIYKSADAGQHWSLVGDTRHLGWLALQIEVAGGAFYVLTNKGEIERSIDGGFTWKTVLAKPYPIPGPGERLLHIYADGNTVLAGSVLTIYRSINQGETWETTFEDYAERYQGFAQVGGDIFAAHDWLIFKSSDGGLTWQQIFSSSYIFADFTAVDTVLYAMYDGYPRLIRSYDRGVTWDKIDADSIRFYQYHNETRDWLTGSGQDIFYASDYWCTHGGVAMFQSPDRGDEWFSTKRNGLRHHWLRDLKALPGQLLAATIQGVFRSTDHGDSFASSHEGMNAAWISYLLKTGNSRWWSITRHGVFSSDDDGGSWQFRFPHEIEDPCWTIEKPLVATSARVFYQNSATCKVWYSEDNGNIWQELPLFQTWECPTIDASTSALWYALHNRVFKLQDGENTLEEIAFPGSGTAFIWGLKIENEKIYLNLGDSKYISNDEGNSWDIVPKLDIGSQHFNEYYEILDDDILWNFVRTMDSNGIKDLSYGFHFQENQWRLHTFVDAQTGDPISANEVTFLKKEGNIRWIGTRTRGLCYSADLDTDEVYPFEPQLPYKHLTDLYLDNKNLWVGTVGAGIYRIQLDTSSQSNIGAVFALSPNPSASAPTLTSDVFFTEGIHLRVFDAVGRLVGDRQMPPGNRWEINLEGVSAGVYLWQIQTSRGTAVLKWVKPK